eukprot:6191216-Pleurochrysis_carterae.AAC.1
MATTPATALVVSTPAHHLPGSARFFCRLRTRQAGFDGLVDDTGARAARGRCSGDSGKQPPADAPHGPRRTSPISQRGVRALARRSRHSLAS